MWAKTPSGQHDPGTARCGFHLAMQSKQWFAFIYPNRDNTPKAFEPCKGDDEWLCRKRQKLIIQGLQHLFRLIIQKSQCQMQVFRWQRATNWYRALQRLKSRLHLLVEWYGNK
ncbi:hypothetical protein RUE5091_04158 [Ruegeria denitrificans]|uniref:Uncharacterized protein n=1 Tax=Ruegeria denitrificans TaxID=1715692 RepID=A0A0P1ISC7_9RHOB|nr:hypothetical protein [Ruegeria denitrificans]CUK17781.1 hypothetical protein RUE5091_04158 [Ruegeria denitrificans]